VASKQHGHIESNAPRSLIDNSLLTVGEKKADVRGDNSPLQ